RRLRAHCWQAILHRKVYELFAVERGESAMKDDKRIGSLLCHRGVDSFKLTFVLHSVGLNLNFQPLSCSLRLLQFVFISPRTPVVKDSHAGELGDRLLEKF